MYWIQPARKQHLGGPFHGRPAMPTRRQPTTTIPGQAFPAGPCQARKPNRVTTSTMAPASCCVLPPGACCCSIRHPNPSAACVPAGARVLRRAASSNPFARPYLPAVRPGGGRKEGRTGGEAPPTSALAAAAVTGGTGNSLTPWCVPFHSPPDLHLHGARAAVWRGTGLAGGAGSPR